ncbi:MAG: hypothetical protein KAI70_01755 [Candidatus Omnitrophica bacterium]|nr:hypothetical protein [Candidatus Omnitrophota bacterium]
MRKTLVCAVLCFFVFSLCANADIIHLKNGRKITGMVVLETEDIIEVDIGGGTATHFKEDIDFIEKAEEEKSAIKKTVAKTKKKVSEFGVVAKIKEQWDKWFPQKTEAQKKSEHYYKIAMSFKQKGDIPNAFLNIEKAINSGSKSGKVYAALGALYADKGQKGQAIRYMKIAVKMFEEEMQRYQRENNPYMAGRARLLLGSMKLQLRKVVGK